jgi:hypothetical protein
MSSRTLLNLALLAAVIGLVLIVILGPKTEPEPPRTKVSGHSASAISRITIHRADRDDIVLTRHNDQWQLEAPFQASAAGYRADTLTRLVEAESQATYPAAEVDLSQMQLDPPLARLDLDTLSFAFGGTEPLSHQRYVLFEDKVFLLEDRYYHYLVAPPTDFVDTALLPGAPNLKAIQLPHLALQQEDGHWQLDPERNDVSADDITALVDQWRYARAVEVKRDEAQQDTTADTSESIKVVRADTQEIIRFLIRSKDPELVLVRPDLRLVYHLSKSAAERLLQLPKKAAEKPLAGEEDIAQPETSGEVHE